LKRIEGKQKNRNKKRRFEIAEKREVWKRERVGRWGFERKMREIEKMWVSKMDKVRKWETRKEVE
jgi:hypothetical protein